MTDYTEYTVRVYANGDRFWRTNDKLNRLDGPACEYANGNRYWFLNGEGVTQEDHARLISQPEEMTLAQVYEALGKNIKIVKG